MNPDPLSLKILKILKASDRPLVTTEVAREARDTREKILTRLQRMKDSGDLGGRHVFAGSQGIWLWWRKDAFVKVNA